MVRGFFCFGAFLIFIFVDFKFGFLPVTQNSFTNGMGDGRQKTEDRSTEYLDIPPRIVYEYQIPGSWGYSLFNIGISATIQVKVKFYQDQGRTLVCCFFLSSVL